MEDLYFGKNLKFLRKNKGLTQTDIANLLELNKAIVANYELSINNPPLKTLIKIADYFNVSVDDLLRRDMSVGEGGSVVSDGILPYGNNKACQLRVAELESVIELQKKYIALLEGNIK